MAHAHDHQGGGYFLEQLCTVGVCGALGAVIITMWAIPNGLNFLGPQFQAPLGNAWLSPIFWGGVIVAAMGLVLAAATVIKFKGRKRLYETDSGHEYFWVPCHYVLVLFPVGLYWLGLAPTAFSSHPPINMNFDGLGQPAPRKYGEVIRDLPEVARGAFTEGRRHFYEGKTAQLVGQATNIETRRFGLIRYQISCCAADAVPLKLVISVPAATEQGEAFDGPTLLAGKWVRVTGVIQFRKLRDSDEYITVLEVLAEDVEVLPKPPENPFVY
jgi:hypothetical protein